MNWIARHRRLALALICAVWTLAVATAVTFPELPFIVAIWEGEQSFQDLLRREGRKTPAREDFVFVGIDQQSLHLDAVGAEEIAGSRALELLTERPYPWSRELWALFLDKVFASGARLVMFDMIFSPPNDGDPMFAASLEKYRDRVVIGANFDESSGAIVGPNATLIPPPSEGDDRVGLVNFWPDLNDGVVRAARYLVSERQLAKQAPYPGSPVFESLAARIMSKLGRPGDVPPALELYPIRFGGADAYQPRNLWEVFSDPVWEANYGGGAFFKDKIVMVGASATVMHDVVSTPLGPSTYGPALHLHALAAALAHEFLSYTRPALAYTLLGGAGFLAWVIIAFLRRPILSLVALVGITLGYLVIARLLYDQWGFFLLAVPVLVAFVGSGASSLGLDYILERIEKLRTRRTLERYVSKNLVKDILDNPTSFYSTMKGARIPVTVLFTDLIGFTTLSERADPEELVRQLNEYLSKMVGVVFENNGTLDKFIGDAIMAVWGNVQSQGPVTDAKACARAALGMRRALKELNEGWRGESRMTLGMGVGINSGEALAGNIGSGDRADLTVIGDAVNLASRLEALTRTYGVDLLVGEAAAKLIRDEFQLRSVARVQVKGKTVPVSVSTLLCAKGEPYDAEFLKWLESYEEGIAKFLAREFTAGKMLFARFLEFYPDDYLAKMYLDRTLEYEKEPPHESWTGAEVFTKK
ncbi:MAG: adenylate/guanylate cyclase domain-containing protein [Chthoniobacterales bacterium]|nr:adenylate/guanylate cyclase domain-containing protein [Chthoniobacterales bacterium]